MKNAIKDITKEFDIVIGLEVHCVLTTKSKNFSGARNEFTSEANANISEVCLGFPGTLPVVNKEAVRKALMAALAMNCKTPNEIVFDRKNYYYPDVPKNYQLTQATKPVGVDGYVMVVMKDGDKRIGIHDTHLEEDAAAMDHFKDYSLIDYNRAGGPLLETVTTPCIYSADEAVAFLETLRSIFLYCGIAEADPKKGQIRCDVNISLKPKGSEILGTRVEMKNINSFTNVRMAIESEAVRQADILRKGGELTQETRRFDDVKGKTFSMRSKADAVDYKYYLEPNLVPVKVSDEWISEIRDEIPMLQFERIEKYIEWGLSRGDAIVLAREKGVADYFEDIVSGGVTVSVAANWIVEVMLGYLAKLGLEIGDISVKSGMLVELISMVESGKVSRNQAKDVLEIAIEKSEDPVKLIDKMGMSQISDDEEIRNIVREVLKEQVASVEQYRGGDEKVLNFLVGQVMRKTGGKANPGMTRGIVVEEITKG
ncbi:Asp-tRNA(Asn)/Glu-tRNA(Gln) amidotransferase subunit GatB [Candidatus Saccharibacteria bacterium]|nr:Asp-tRNA(Asn)/Glu-tRNA(Gln) amidotransferase subunit GatB [Candidatus Saccharibacteria bacterium]